MMSNTNEQGPVMKGSNSGISEPGRISAFIFDMDGTLLESTKIDYNAWVMLFGEYGSDFVSFDEYRKLLGVKSIDIIKEYLTLEGDGLDMALKKRLQFIKDIIEEEGLMAVPYAEQFLIDAKNASFKMALATGARQEKMETVLGKVGLGKYFDVIVTGDDVRKGKPDPALFLEAAKRLGIEPSQAIVVEDAENGISAAKNAGMKSIAITTTTPAEELMQADLIINSYKGLDPIQIGAQLSRPAPG
jgi:HAD superfamily hydrolase (TIGR01509 family)